MKIASAESARALTQAVLVARLCGRYHDLGSYASELLKQRIHFLAKPDGSNLKELFIWDLPSSASSSLSTTSWTTVQIDEYIQEHWSADQFPLNAPNHARSWEEADVYYKALDTDTVQAIIPIGHQDGATLVIVLQVETEDSAATEGEACWKYHNMAIVREGDLKAQGWNILLDQTLHPTNDTSPTLPPCTNMEVSGNDVGKEDDNGEDGADSDDDYWGQYGDTEEDDSSTEEHVGQDEAVKDLTETTSETTHDEDGDEDEYWRKYAEHQEEQEELERKRKLKQQQHQQAELQELQQKEQNNVVASRTGLPTSSTPIGQVDPTMLSSLLQMLTAEGTVNSSPSGHADPTHMHTIPVDASLVTPSTAPLSRDGNSRSDVLSSMRSMVDQATRAGYSKDEVFEMLGSIYNTPE
ncbi:hypothetical protein BGZ58_005833 [Dissophora ornata]|nr:hypothetical protein BGZ58_005833 [Dissophora ornata]